MLSGSCGWQSGILSREFDMDDFLCGQFLIVFERIHRYLGPLRIGNVDRFGVVPQSLLGLSAGIRLSPSINPSTRSLSRTTISNDLAATLIAELAATTVLVLLFSDLAEAPTRASELGALGCLRKPDDVARIGKVLLQLVAQIKRRRTATRPNPNRGR